MNMLQLHDIIVHHLMQVTHCGVHMHPDLTIKTRASYRNIL